MLEKTVGITGPISEVNFGDYAMLINNIYDLNIKDIIVFSYNKGFSEQIVKAYLQDFNVEIIEVKLKNKKEEVDRTSKKVGFLPFNYPTTTPIDIMYRLDNIDEIKEKIDQIDLLLVNGGGYFNHLWNNSLWRSDMLQKIIGPILIANQKNKKIVFTGNGIGPFEQSEEFFNYFFNYLKKPVLAVRDRMYSQVYLEKLGFSKDQINFIPDDLYIINKKLMNIKCEQPLDIINKKYIVLELYYALDELENYLEKLKAFSKKMFEKYNVSIVFLPFDLERGGVWQGEYLQKNLENFYLYDLKKTGYLPVQDLINIIQGAEMVVCSRYHALVLSLGNKTPVVNTLKKVCNDYRYYLNKNYGVLEYTFENQIFDELDFLKIGFSETLDFVSENYEQILETQNKLFSSEQFELNRESLKKIRSEYFSQYILEELR